MAPIITIAGRSNSGKTTLVEKLVHELTNRGYRIGTIKDSHKRPTFDVEGKDSARHVAAGSVVTAIRTGKDVAVLRNVSEDTPLMEIAQLLGEDVDLIIAEGFKYADVPKIEVHRTGRELLENPENLIAIATQEKLETEVPQFDINDFSGICDLLETDFILPNQQRVSLYINGQLVELKEYPQKIIASVVSNMLLSLKGIDHVENVDISVRKANM